MLRDALMEAAGGVDAVRGKLRAGAAVPPPREWEQPLANELSDAALLVEGHAALAILLSPALPSFPPAPRPGLPADPPPAFSAAAVYPDMLGARVMEAHRRAEEEQLRGFAKLRASIARKAAAKHTLGAALLSVVGQDMHALRARVVLPAPPPPPFRGPDRARSVAHERSWSTEPELLCFEIFWQEACEAAVTLLSAGRGFLVSRLLRRACRLCGVDPPGGPGWRDAARVCNALDFRWYQRRRGVAATPPEVLRQIHALKEGMALPKTRLEPLESGALLAPPPELRHLRPVAALAKAWRQAGGVPLVKEAGDDLQEARRTAERLAASPQPRGAAAPALAPARALLRRKALTVGRVAVALFRRAGSDAPFPPFPFFPSPSCLLCIVRGEGRGVSD